jgi:hypothetical protein
MMNGEPAAEDRTFTPSWQSTPPLGVLVVGAADLAAERAQMGRVPPRAAAGARIAGRAVLGVSGRLGRCEGQHADQWLQPAPPAHSCRARSSCTDSGAYRALA